MKDLQRIAREALGAAAFFFVAVGLVSWIAFFVIVVWSLVTK
jgi:hypothetical protein